MKIIEANLLGMTEGVICHQVNCQGVMGSGIAKQISDKWPEVYDGYMKNCNKEDLSKSLGLISYVQVDDNLLVANVFGQDRYGTDRRQTNYGAVAEAFQRLKYAPGPVYVPYLMGCGLAGGDWDVYSEIIEYFIPDAIVCKWSPS